MSSSKFKSSRRRTGDSGTGDGAGAGARANQPRFFFGFGFGFAAPSSSGPSKSGLYPGECRTSTCAQINQSSLGDDAAVLAESIGEIPPPRRRAGIASMAWRTRRDNLIYAPTATISSASKCVQSPFW